MGHRRQQRLQRQRQHRLHRPRQQRQRQQQARRMLYSRYQIRVWRLALLLPPRMGLQHLQTARQLPCTLLPAAAAVLTRPQVKWPPEKS
jgi:hypothetical protein